MSLQASSRAAEGKPAASYYWQRMALIADIKKLIRDEASAIASLDMEKLSKAVRKIEGLQAKLEHLDRKQKTESESLTDSERDALLRSLGELLRMHDDNLKCLLAKRETILQELKSVRVKKTARKAYGSFQNKKANLNKSR